MDEQCRNSNYGVVTYQEVIFMDYSC